MKYSHGTNDSFSQNYREATVSEMVDIIKNGVEKGNLNLYNGGKEDCRMATCRFCKVGFIFNYKLKILGTQEEFTELEAKIKEFIEVIPREFN